MKMRLAIIGAGAAGIVSLKYALEAGFECECIEETETFGGTWNYTDKSGTNKFGFPIHRTMYKNLKTTVPKELMTFLDASYPTELLEYFLTQPQVLQYLTDYVNKFNLEKQIKYYESVVKVEWLSNNTWRILTINIKNNILSSKTYDAVLICSGRYRFPRIPKYPGQELFKGHQMHSCNYRSPEAFNGKRVLIIGGSFSALDISHQLQGIAKMIFLSHKTGMNVKYIIIKTAVKQFCESGVVFEDGTKEEFDVVIYCTGYDCKFPYLTESCGIIVENNYISPLYKNIVNIKHPSMYFIGMVTVNTSFLTCDIQARFVVAAIAKKFSLPIKKSMLKQLKRQVLKLEKNNIPLDHIHKLGINQGNYYKELAKIAPITPTSPILSDVFKVLYINLCKSVFNTTY
ncbi:hypothetical protein FQA39_LY09776 [Lamprigera yunnana]|nr:hypothetical protein FQA39_LY09776 [Lamprigera yunnana]